LSERSSGTFIEYDYKKPLNTGYPTPSPGRNTYRTPEKPKPAASAQRIVYDDASGELRVGMFVEHDKFGQGKVIHKEGEGSETKVVVFFQNHGQKKLALKFAKLKILG
jgi:DNA helicase-2/ATP-dependent DNA helicase PcrA